MKRTPLARKSPLSRGKGKKRSQPKRDWRQARKKVDEEGVCRLSRNGLQGCAGKLEAAHIVSREHDRILYEGRTPVYRVLPIRVCPLCTHHHAMYDRHELSILEVLTVDEQAQAVKDAGGIMAALKRTTGVRSWVPADGREESEAA